MKQEERARLTSSRIIKAAIEEFGTRGYDGGTIGEICRTGINKGLIYHYFKNKDDLYLRCLQISCDRLLEKLQTVRTEERTASDIVHDYMSTRLGYFKTYPCESRIVFECRLAPPEKISTQIAGILQPLEQRNREVYQAALSGLKLRKGINMERAMRYFTMMQSMYNSYYGSPVMNRKSLEEKMVEHEEALPDIINCMLYGIAEEEGME